MEGTSLEHGANQDDKQLASLLRRAIELGAWELQWVDTNPVL